MDDWQTKPSDGRCPNCGGPIDGYPPDHACMGVRCLSCDWNLVTTNNRRRHPSRDQAAYTVWVDTAGADRRAAIAKVGNVLCIGVAAARRMMDAGAPVAVGVSALEVQRLYRLFRAQDLGVRVEPPFPWPWQSSS